MDERPDLGPRYHPIRHLANGANSEIWLAQDRDTGFQLAVKAVPIGAGPDRTALLAREFEIARRLEHPNLVQVFDLHRSEDLIFMTMELLPGGDLGPLRGRPLDQLMPLIREIADALAYLHGCGVVHRDLKIGNVLLDENGRAHLTDLGIAGVAPSRALGLDVSHGGSRFGTSPEQAEGQPPDPADDVYGLGALIYELITGYPPRWNGDRTSEPVASSAPEELDTPWPIPRDLQTLVRSMLANSAGARPDMARVVAVLAHHDPAPGVVATGPVNGAADRPIRLSPPPRVERVSPGSQPGTGRLSSGRTGQLPRWLKITVVVTLGSALAAVFLILPRWVERHPTAPVPDSVAPIPRPTPPTPVSGRSTDNAGEAELRSHEPAGPAPTQAPLRTQPTQQPPGPEVDQAAFSSAMSQGLSAIADEDFEAALVAFRRAVQLRPSSAAAADGVTRATAGLRLQSIDRHRRQAALDEAAERWHQATEQYDAILAIDPTVTFAQRGTTRAAERADLADRIQFHLGHPDRLSSGEVLDEASALLSEARQATPRGPVLADQITRLDRLIEVASTPVHVELESDGLTHVVIYNVGPLGTFSRRTVELRPGTYTVVGTRDGFRDVRLQITVRPGRPADPLVIQCQEEI
jgi:serine/threonine protein kinase